MTNTAAAHRAVKVWLAQNGKTQMWLAKRLRVHYSQLSRILNGHEKSERVTDALYELTGISVTGDKPETAKAS